MATETTKSNIRSETVPYFECEGCGSTVFTVMMGFPATWNVADVVGNAKCASCQTVVPITSQVLQLAQQTFVESRQSERTALREY